MAVGSRLRDNTVASTAAGIVLSGGNKKKRQVLASVK